MEPVKIEASPTQAGVQIEAFDAQELFERAGAALSQSRYADAIAAYERLLTVFPDSVYGRSALYNKGLAHRDKRDFPRAVDSFRTLVDRWPDHADAKDALFQMGACHAEQENWPTSAEVFARLLERKDLTSDDRIEALARRGFAQLKLGDLDTAEKTFRSALAHAEAIKDTERLETDFFLAFSQFNIGELTHERFRRSPIRLPERQMERDLEEKARLLLSAQRAYIGTIKYGNARWASAAGFQVGALYEEMYEAFVGAPVPSALSTEGRNLYLEELRKKIRILLEKSLRWYRENLLMVERLGVDTDWAEKTRLAYAKLVRLLDPAAPSEIGTRPERRLPPSPGLGGPGLPPPSTPPAPGDPGLGTWPAEAPRSAPPPSRQVL
jgi:tetratricopeptide (TPR) repeat protein